MPTSAGDVLKHHLRPYCDWCDVGSRTLQVRTAARQGTFTFRLVSLADMRVAFPGLVYRMGPIMVSRLTVSCYWCSLPQPWIDDGEDSTPAVYRNLEGSYVASRHCGCS